MDGGRSPDHGHSVIEGGHPQLAIVPLLLVGAKRHAPVPRDVIASRMILDPRGNGRSMREDEREETMWSYAIGLLLPGPLGPL